MTCERCGAPFPPGRRRGKPRRWCTDACRHLARHPVATRQALAALGAVRARLAGPGYFGDETRLEVLGFIERAEAALVAGDQEPLVHEMRREVRIGLLVLRAQLDDLLARVTRP